MENKKTPAFELDFAWSHLLLFSAVFSSYKTKQSKTKQKKVAPFEMFPKGFFVNTDFWRKLVFLGLKIPTTVNVLLSEMLLSKGKEGKVEISCEQLLLGKTYLLIREASQWNLE